MPNRNSASSTLLSNTSFKSVLTNPPRVEVTLQAECQERARQHVGLARKGSSAASPLERIDLFGSVRLFPDHIDPGADERVHPGISQELILLAHAEAGSGEAVAGVASDRGPLTKSTP